MEIGKSTSGASLSSKGKALGKVFLTDEQKHVADLVINEKKSVFFTGSAGWLMESHDLTTVLT